MKILKVEIDQEEEQKVYDGLIKHFDETGSEIFGLGQQINFPLNELVEVYSELSIYRNPPKPPDENNQSEEPSQFPDMYDYTLQFFIEGTEIEVVRNSTIGLNIESKIQKHFTR